MDYRQLADRIAILSPGARSLLEALAVLEQADQRALAALAEQAPQPALDELIALGLAEAGDGWYTLDQGLREAVLEELSATRRRELHRRAARLYARLLADAGADQRDLLEQRYMQHQERCCEALIQQEPAALAAEVAGIPEALLQLPRHRHLLRYYRGLGEGLCDRFAAARAEFEHLLAEPGLDDAIRARTLNSSAVFARHQGDYQQALSYYQASYEIAVRLNDKVRQGLVRKNMGIMQHVLQDFARAEVAFQDSARLFNEAGNEHLEALAYNELGLLCRDQGRWDEALDHFRRVAASCEREGAIDFLGRVNNNVGELELVRGNLAEAAACFERAIEQMTTRAYVVDALINLGLTCQARGDHVAALAHYGEALRLAIELERREMTVLVHGRIADAQWRLGRLDEAQASYTAAAEAVEATREPLRDEGLLLGLMGRWQTIYESALLLALERGDHAAAFGYAERSRARAFADALARHGGELPQERAMPLTAGEAQSHLAAGLLLLSYFATGMRGPESALLEAMPARAAAVRALLDVPRRLILLAVTRVELQAFECALDPALLQAPSPFLHDGRRFLRPAVLRRCYDALIAPVAALVAQAQQIVVIPHGPLHQLPFAALLSGEGQPLLDSSARLCYAPSATVLLRALPRRRPPSDGCLALGYDGAAGRGLRHTEAEAQEVALLCGGRALRGREGIRGELSQQAGRYRWLHLACHGEFSLDDPLASWLEIGPDERLSAADVLADFKLQAELVTLSACRSGVSKVLRGDEPMGLVRAFLSAGARAVLVTLWPVEDTSARLLVEHFYRALLSQSGRHDPSAALNDAQRALRGMSAAQLRQQLREWGIEAGSPLPDADLPYAAPEYWAAYVLVAGTTF